MATRSIVPSRLRGPRAFAYASAVWLAGLAAAPAQRPNESASRPVAAPESRPAAVEERGDFAALYKERRYDELLERIEPKLVDRLDAAEAWLMAAEASLASEDAPTAAARFETALRLRPDAKPLCVNYGFALLRVDRLVEAKKWFSAFVEDPKKDRSAKARYGLGLAAKASGDVEQARAAFEASIALAPDDARPRYRLGEIHLEDGRYHDAAEAFRDALERDRLLCGAAYGLARATRLMGRVAEADAYDRRHAELIRIAEAVRKALRSYGTTRDPARVCFDIGASYAIAGDKKSALFWIDKSLEHDPNHPTSVALRPVLAARKFERP